MLVTWVAQLEIEADVGNSITNDEVELSLAKASGPDFHNLIEATKGRLQTNFSSDIK